VSAASFARALSDALLLASEGHHCFPCLTTKRPASPHGFKDATRDPDALRALWLKYPGVLIGVSTGSISGIDALDVDVKHPEAKFWWEDTRHRFPQTRIHRTRSGGLHLLFKHHNGVRCTAGKIALGIDTRAAGGYVIWWPANGLPVLSDVPPAAWPQWLLSELRPKAQSSFPITRVPNHNFIAKLVQVVAGASEGERNSLTFWAACRAGEMVTSGMLSADAAAAVIVEAATRAGLPRAEAERTARSGIRAGRRPPPCLT
jgi:Bifunctional DNA primase/polymerase, N-terminal